MSAILRNNASVDALHSGDIAAARGHLETAFEAYQAMGVENFNVKGNLGMVLREEGDLDAARELVEEGLRIGRRAGDRYALAYSLLCLGLIAGDLNDWTRAASFTVPHSRSSIRSVSHGSSSTTHGPEKPASTQHKQHSAMTGSTDCTSAAASSAPTTRCGWRSDAARLPALPPTDHKPSFRDAQSRQRRSNPHASYRQAFGWQPNFTPVPHGR